MASEFSYLTSPENDDSAVDAIISQAIDLSDLEQIAALNSSHLSDSSLPTNLETRFQKLKSFPGKNKPASPIEAEPDKPMKPDVLAPNRANNEAEITSPTKSNGRKELDPKLRDGFSSSPLPSPDSSRESPSPPRQTCCFGCSSRRASKKNGKDERLPGLRFDGIDWGKNDEVLTDFSTFSFKEQQRKLKKALKEEEMASREAEKVVEWVKQASARMDVSVIDAKFN